MVTCYFEIKIIRTVGKLNNLLDPEDLPYLCNGEKASVNKMQK